MFYKNLLKTWEYKFPLPPVLPIVIYNGLRKLKAPTEFSKLIENKIGIVQKYVPKFEYFLIDLSQLDKQQLLRLAIYGKNTVSALFTLEKADYEELIEILNKIIKKFKINFSDAIIKLLKQYLELVFTTDKNIKDDVKEIIETIEEDLDMLVSNFHRSIKILEQEAYKESILEGKLEGLLEGKRKFANSLYKKILALKKLQILCILVLMK